MPSSAILETQDLTVRFGGVTALDHVNFTLGDKELRCLIGPNGAGKSTFFKCVTGQLEPSEGRVEIRGAETTGWLPHEVARLGIGIKTQVPSVMNGLSVHENVWLAAKRKRSAKTADRLTSETIERLKLGPVARDMVGTLAHGQRQLVELGIVLAGRPWLVLLDEPAAGLTGDEVGRLVDVIREINREASLIIVEHDMHFIRSIASTVTVFHQGRILMQAPVAEVMNDPRVRDVYLGRKR